MELTLHLAAVLIVIMTVTALGFGGRGLYLYCDRKKKDIAEPLYHKVAILSEEISWKFAKLASQNAIASVGVYLLLSARDSLIHWSGLLFIMLYIGWIISDFCQDVHRLKTNKA